MGPFDNDDAMDWVSTLEDADDFAPISDTFSAAEQPGYIDADVASIVIAAAETLAAMYGAGSASLPDEAKDYIGRVNVSTPDHSMLKSALQALDRIKGESSELRELWAEAGEEKNWIAAGDALSERVRSLLS